MEKLYVLYRKYWKILLLIIFVLHIGLRVYQLEEKAVFGPDQVDNAWTAKNLIVNKKIPLEGMVAKANTGFYIGPLYYYYIIPFYAVTDLDPIASPIIAALTSIFTFFVLFFCIRGIFSREVAFVAVFLYAVASYAIGFDRIQWPVNFIVPVSLLIFYSLYKIIAGKSKYIFLLSILLGASLHINFTSVFFFILVFLALPFFPRNKKTLKYILLAIPLFLIFLIPSFFAELQSKASSSRHIASYVQTYYHGIHLVRVLQLAKDAFIEFDGMLYLPSLKILKYILLPLFALLYLRRHRTQEKMLVCYLMILWFLVPWGVFSVYRGEISNYYFSLTRPIVLIVISYLLVTVGRLPSIIPKITIVCVLLLFAYVNITAFFQSRVQNLSFYKQKMFPEAKAGGKHPFTAGSPESYLFYYYSRKLYGKN